MEINTPHFNAIAGQFLTEAKNCSKKKPMKPLKSSKKKPQKGK